MKNFKWKKICSVFLILFLITGIVFTFATPKVNYEVNRIQTNKKVIMLTFDDGPGLADEKIMDILKEHDAVATFFGTGINYEKYWDQNDHSVKLLVDRMIKEGHSLGNHSYYHQKYLFKTKAASTEFYQTSAMIVKIYAQNGIKKEIADIPVRMPYLQYYRGMDYLQKQLKIKSFIRGYLGCDYKEQACGQAKILKQYQSHLRYGQILVCHTRAYATNWLPQLLKYLDEQNYKTTNFTSGVNDYKNYGGLVF